MNKRQVLANLNQLAYDLEEKGFYKEAESITNYMIKIAKQGSLWSRLGPDFKQKFNEIIEESIVDFNFDSYVGEKYPNIKPGVHKAINLVKLTEKFRAIAPEEIKHIQFTYDYEMDQKTSGNWVRDYSAITINFDDVQHINKVKHVLKHELFHAVDNILAIDTKVEFRKRRRIDKEFSVQPRNFKSTEFKTLDEKSLSEEDKKATILKIEKFLLDKIPALSLQPEKLRDEALKQYNIMLNRAKSIHGDFDLYTSTLKELRAFRAQLEDLFSTEYLIEIYQNHYKNKPNGKNIFLKQFYDLIQNMVNVKDVGQDYKKSELFNHIRSILPDYWRKFDESFEKQMMHNLDEQYVRQIAKYLSNTFLEIKEILKDE